MYDREFVMDSVNHCVGDDLLINGGMIRIHAIVVVHRDGTHVEIGYHDCNGHCFHVVPCVLETKARVTSSNR